MATEYQCPSCSQLMDTVETCCSVSYWCEQCQQQYTPEEMEELIRSEHKKASCCGD